MIKIHVIGLALDVGTLREKVVEGKCLRPITIMSREESEWRYLSTTSNFVDLISFSTFPHLLDEKGRGKAIFEQIWIVFETKNVSFFCDRRTPPVVKNLIIFYLKKKHFFHLFWVFKDVQIQFEWIELKNFFLLNIINNSKSKIQ